MMKKNEKKVIQPEGNYYDKYNSTNPIVRWMMGHFFRDLDFLLDYVENVTDILEAGCGEGEVIGYVAKRYGGKDRIDAFDISERVVSDAQMKYPDVCFSTGDIYNISNAGGGSRYSLVICSEVLEHLDHPEKALEQLTHVAEEYIVLSVPREPLWRCLNMVRGKYIKDYGNTPGHIQHWSSGSFIHFLKQNGMDVILVKKPLPWTMVLVRRKRV